MLKIARLEKEHFAPYLELARHMQQECEPDIPFDEHELVLNMFRCVGDPDRQMLNSWISMRGNKVVGMAVGSATPFYFSTKLTAILNYWYVMSEYRDTRVATELLRAFERWAREIGAVRIYVGAERINDVALADRVNAMIEKRGFTRFGHQFYKRIQ